MWLCGLGKRHRRTPLTCGAEQKQLVEQEAVFVTPADVSTERPVPIFSSSNPCSYGAAVWVVLHQGSSKLSSGMENLPEVIVGPFKLLLVFSRVLNNLVYASYSHYLQAVVEADGQVAHALSLAAEQVHATSMPHAEAPASLQLTWHAGSLQAIRIQGCLWQALGSTHPALLLDHTQPSGLAAALPKLLAPPAQTSVPRLTQAPAATFPVEPEALFKALISKLERTCVLLDAAPVSLSLVGAAVVLSVSL